ncbi:MAG: M3 family metallopeptidase, partial [Bacteroidales bacterium]|nr:M3 family metallopeptidase [Bacteroidales bacterium]
MRKTIIAAALAMTLCGTAMAQNPLLQRRYGTPYEIPPFEKITVDNYREAMLIGIEEEKAEIMAIIQNRAMPTFENVIVALDKCGETLDKAGIWSNLNSSNSTPELQALANELSPKTSELSNFINMNEELFNKVKYVYDNQAKFNLNKEQTTLLEKTYKRFVNGGALLSPEKKEELAALNLKMSSLTLKFSQNLLHDTNNTYVIADKLSELAGLPQANIDQAAELAAKIGKPGKYAFNMQRPSCNPVLQYCSNRELRKKVYLMYNDRCNHNDEYDNKEIAKEIVALRLKRSQIMGSDTFAETSLESKMAGNADNVYNLLDQIWGPAVERAKDEIADIKAMMKADKIKGEPQRWDYMYYLDKAKKAKYNIDEAEISEYLEIDA